MVNKLLAILALVSVSGWAVTLQPQSLAPSTITVPQKGNVPCLTLNQNDTIDNPQCLIVNGVTAMNGTCTGIGCGAITTGSTNYWNIPSTGTFPAPYGVNASTLAATTIQISSNAILGNATYYQNGYVTTPGIITANAYASAGSANPTNGWTQSTANAITIYTGGVAGITISSTQNVLVPSLSATYGVVASTFSGNGANLTNITGSNVGSGVPAANIAAGTLGSSVIASSIAVATVNNVQVVAGTFSNITLPAANVAAGTLGGSVIASSVAASGSGANTYGSSTVIPVIKFGVDGRLTSVSSATVSIVLKVPTIQRFTSGTLQTYTTPTSPVPLYIRVKMVGGGGGGSGSGTAGAGNGQNGTASIFATGSSTTSAGGGTGGSYQANGPSGGTNSVSLGTAIQTITGGSGGGFFLEQTSGGGQLSGAYGGSTPLSGGARSGAGNNAGQTGTANTGEGGQGGATGSTGANNYGGDGGGGGGYVDFIISSPGATYTYTVGGGGSNGGAGTNGNAGGSGGTGLVVVEEYYQ